MPAFTFPHRPVALAYHAVGRAGDDLDPLRLIVSPEHLSEHIRLLQRRGYRFVTAEELLDETGGKRPPARTALLTFDDGFAGWLTEALPVLEGLGVPASFYVCPGWWGRRHPDVRGAPGQLLDEAGVRRLADSGMCLGSHTWSHADLRGLPADDLEREVESSRRAVEEVTGRPCRTFAYPFGLRDPAAVAAVAAAGYELAFDWLPGPWSPLTAPRLPGPPRHGARRLALKLAGIRRPGR